MIREICTRWELRLALQCLFVGIGVLTRPYVTLSGWRGYAWALSGVGIGIIIGILLGYRFGGR